VTDDPVMREFYNQGRVVERDYRREKQDRFEFRVLSALLRAFEPEPGWIRKLVDSARGEFNLVWFNDMYDNFPVKLATCKLGKTTHLVDILKRFEKLTLFKLLQEHADNYPEHPIGLVFASQGDKLPDLVVHNAERLYRARGHWRVLLPAGFALDPLEGFIASVRGCGFSLVED
jgi:hypothetical protein